MENRYVIPHDDGCIRLQTLADSGSLSRHLRWSPSTCTRFAPGDPSPL